MLYQIEGRKMQAALRLTTLAQPGGKIEVTDAQLPAGQLGEVVLLFSQPKDPYSLASACFKAVTKYSVGLNIALVSTIK
jgi:hypothetical protein